jgi:hypothetical protein
MKPESGAQKLQTKNVKVFRTLDRFVIHQINENLFKNQEKKQIKLQKYEEDSSSEDEMEIVKGPKNQEPQLRKIRKPENPIQPVPLKFICTEEERICDETTFLISKLQGKLDNAKTNNFCAL